MKSLQKGVVSTSSGPSKPLYQERSPKCIPSRFDPFKFMFANRSQKAQWKVMLPSIEHSQWEPGFRSTLQERDPEEILTLHYSVVKRLQGPIPLLLPLSYLHWNPQMTTRPALGPAGGSWKATQTPWARLAAESVFFLPLKTHCSLSFFFSPNTI